MLIDHIDLYIEWILEYLITTLEVIWITYYMFSFFFLYSILIFHYILKIFFLVQNIIVIYQLFPIRIVKYKL